MFHELITPPLIDTPEKSTLAEYVAADILERGTLPYYHTLINGIELTASFDGQNWILSLPQLDQGEIVIMQLLSLPEWSQPTPTNFLVWAAFDLAQKSVAHLSKNHKGNPTPELLHACLRDITIRLQNANYLLPATLTAFRQHSQSRQQLRDQRRALESTPNDEKLQREVTDQHESLTALTSSLTMFGAAILAYDLGQSI